MRIIIIYINQCLGNETWLAGKSPQKRVHFLVETSSAHGGPSIARFDYQRVNQLPFCY